MPTLIIAMVSDLIVAFIWADDDQIVPVLLRYITWFNNFFLSIKFLYWLHSSRWILLMRWQSVCIIWTFVNSPRGWLLCHSIISLNWGSIFLLSLFIISWKRNLSWILINFLWCLLDLIVTIGSITMIDVTVFHI